MDEQIAGNHPQPRVIGPCWHTLAELSVASGSADPQLIRAWVASTTQALSLAETDLERIQCATAEAALKVNGRSSHAPSHSSLLLIRLLLAVCGTERDEVEEAQPDPHPSPSMPPATLAGLRTLCGWGFFLLARMAADAPADYHDAWCIIELYLYQEGGSSLAPHASSAAIGVSPAD